MTGRALLNTDTPAFDQSLLPESMHSVMQTNLTLYLTERPVCFYLRLKDIRRHLLAQEHEGRTSVTLTTKLKSG